MASPSRARSPSKPRWQFRLATLLALMVVVAIPLGWYTESARRREQLELARSQAASQILGVGGFFDKASTEVWLDQSRIQDADLANLAVFPEIESIDLTRTAITDAGLEHLKGLRNLKYLRYSGSRVTHAGIRKLRLSLPYLRTDIEP
jgi:hypothetical protein